MALGCVQVATTAELEASLDACPSRLSKYLGRLGRGCDEVTAVLNSLEVHMVQLSPHDAATGNIERRRRAPLAFRDRRPGDTLDPIVGAPSPDQLKGRNEVRVSRSHDGDLESVIERQLDQVDRQFHVYPLLATRLGWIAQPSGKDLDDVRSIRHPRGDPPLLDRVALAVARCCRDPGVDAHLNQASVRRLAQHARQCKGTEVAEVTGVVLPAECLPSPVVHVARVDEDDRSRLALGIQELRRGCRSGKKPVTVETSLLPPFPRQGEWAVFFWVSWRLAADCRGTTSQMSAGRAEFPPMPPHCGRPGGRPGRDAARWPACDTSPPLRDELT